jgi:hypothetical protein
MMSKVDRMDRESDIRRFLDGVIYARAIVVAARQDAAQRHCSS